MPLLTLEAIRGDAGQVSLGGLVHTVTPMDGAAFRDIGIIAEKHTSGASTKEDVSTMYDIAARCVPTLAREDVYRLTMNQINGIIAIAANQVEMVKAMVREVVEKNGERPTGPEADPEARPTADGASAPASPVTTAESLVSHAGSASSIPSAN